MKSVGVLTTDFGLYYDLVRALKARRVPFASLVEDQPLPPHVGVILTTAGEARTLRELGVPLVVYAPAGRSPEVGDDAPTADRPDEAIDAALRILSGRTRFKRVVVGVDPGDHPGVAVLGDGHVVATYQVARPEAVGPAVARSVGSLETREVTVRVGHGASTQRDRTINSLLAEGLPVEVVDETRTSPPTYRTNRERDIQAAKLIALTEGVTVREPRALTPSEGELRDLQRRSRLLSRGRVTISRDLAMQVAAGHLTLEEAVRRQRKRPPADPNG